MTRQDVDPKKWGRKGWSFIDSVIEGYDAKLPNKKEAQEMKKFLNSLGTMLPCSTCRESYRSYAKQNPISEHDLKNRTSVKKWISKYKKKVEKDKLAKLKNRKQSRKTDT